MNGHPVVSWAGPLERASHNLRRATEAFEARRVDEGIEELAQMQARMNEALEFILRNHE